MPVAKKKRTVTRKPVTPTASPEGAVLAPESPVEAPVVPVKAKVTGKVVDRPYLTVEDIREKIWRDKWPDTKFYLVHNYDTKTKQEDPFPVWEFEANGWVVLSEDPKIVRHPGHVLMGKSMKEYQEGQKAKRDRANRRAQPEQEKQKFGDNEVVIDNTVESSSLGDFLD